MAKRTPIYNFYYLQANDIIYPGYDQDNMFTAENEITGIYDYFGQGIISGWKVHWMGCTSDPYVLQQRQALINGYNEDPFSYYGLEYESIGKPANKTTQADIEAAWAKCIVVEPGNGILDVYHVATEYPSFFSISSGQDIDLYIWAEKNVCTSTEYLCDIIVPQYPDPDYDLSNQVVYIGEVYFSGSLQQITQIYYDPARRREISASSGEFQKLLKQALLNHVHSGEGDMPSKISLDSKLTINILFDPANPYSNVFTIVYPAGFNSNNYALPVVYLNGFVLSVNEYTISGSNLYLQNSIQSNDSLQIVYEVAPGTTVYIIPSTTPPVYPDNIDVLSYNLNYIIADGTFTQTDTGEDNTGGQKIYNKFVNWPDYSQINVYIQSTLLDPSTYIFNKNSIGNYDGTITFLGPILPSISSYYVSDVSIKFITPELQITNQLSIDRISSIDAGAFNQGKVQNFRLSTLDHLGLFKNNEPAYFVPTKKLLDSGNHIIFYPEIDSPVQHADYIVNSEIIPLIKSNVNESTTPVRTLFSTPNGLFISYNNFYDFSKIVSLNWNTDTGVPNIFNQTYFGNNAAITIPGGGQPPITDINQLDPKYIWVLCKSVNQFKNIIYISLDHGLTYAKLNLPISQSGFIVTVNDFISTVDAYVYTTPVAGALGAIVSNYNFDAKYLYYIAATDGLYTAQLTRSSNPLVPLWNNPTKNTTNAPTGSLNKISEAMNVGFTKVTINTNGASQTNFTYNNYRTLYAACESGFFVYTSGNGKLFTTLATNYNTDASKFTFTKWLGLISLNSNFSQNVGGPGENQSGGGVVWSDLNGIYLSNSGQFTDYTIADKDGITSTETLTWYEPLTRNLSNEFTVYVASTSNLTSFTSVSSIDGINYSANKYVLIKNQTDLSQNGIYQWDSSSNLVFVNPAPYATKIYVQNGATQANTEWIDLSNEDFANAALQQNINNRAFALFYANIIPNLNENVNCVTGYYGQVPISVPQVAYQNSFLVSTASYIVRVMLALDRATMPIVQFIAWDSNSYGKITSIKHYASANVEGTLVVFTENGIYQSSSASGVDPWVYSRSVNYDPTKFDSTQYAYIRYINTFDAAGAANASTYEDFALVEYKGQLVSLGLSTNIRPEIPDGLYLNNNLNTQYTSSFVNRKNATIDIAVKSGIVTATINNPGAGYEFNLPSAKFNQLPYCIIGTSGQNYTIFFSNIYSKGLFYADSLRQSFTYSLNIPVNPSRLLYETSYTQFYVSPWKDTLASVAQVVPSIFNVPINVQQYPYSYNSSAGTISFSNSIGLSNKDNLTVSLINVGQYIYDTGTTPHIEINNLNVVSGESFGTLSLDYPDPNNLTSNILHITYATNYSFSSLPQNQTFTVQITDATAAIYRENIICYADSGSNVVRIYLRPQPTTNNNSVVNFAAGSFLYLVKPFSSYGIQDKISLAQSKQPYYLSSVINANVYNLYNTVATLNSNIFNYPTLPQENLTGVDRGLKNTISIRDINSFDPSATFSGFAFGVDPSSSDVAAAPSVINLILEYNPGVEAKFATDKGLWIYSFVTNTWTRSDTLNNSQLVYFADGAHGNTPSTAGTNKGFFEISKGQYVLNPLFSEPITSYLTGSWNSSTKTFYAYGKSHGLSFTLKDSTSNSITSDFENAGFNAVNNLHYAIFKRFDENNNVTWHPAIYLATDRSIWAYTTDPVPNAPALKTPHTILYGREMLGYSLLNSNKIDPTQPGTIPVQVYQIAEIPSGGKQNWLVAATSNGLYVFVNWLSCDVGDPAGLTFYAQNQYSANKTIGHHCYVFIASSEDPANTYYVGTEIGVFKSTNKCGVWSPCAKFNNHSYSVSDLNSFAYNSKNYLVAATSNGLWISDDGGNSWYTAQAYPDSNIAIPTTPVFGVSLDKNPLQAFSSPVAGSVNKAFLYLNSANVSASTNLYATISNGSATTLSSTSINFTNSTFPSMYAFSFSTVQINANQTYYLGLSTVPNAYANVPGITWGLSNLTNPYLNGFAQTSGGVLNGQDFFFKINLATPPAPIEVIEPVGFYNTSYAIGFASGKYIGASINTSGALISNVGIVCNILVDISKSIEINDTGIITSQGISTDYVKFAVLNSVIGPQGLATRVTNSLGTSKILISLYAYNNSIIDLISNTPNNAGSSYGCLSSNQNISNSTGYTNNFSSLSNSLSFVNNTGRLSRLYDAALFTSQLQFTQAVIDFYSDPNNVNQLDQNYLNVSVAAANYQSSTKNYIVLVLSKVSAGVYNVYYQNSNTNFLFPNYVSYASAGYQEGYQFGFVSYTDGSSNVIGDVNTINSIGASGIYNDTINPSKTAQNLYLSYDWPFSSTGLSTSFNDCLNSISGKTSLLQSYAYSFKPLIIVTTDGNDNSNNTPSDVNSAIVTAWDGFGTQMLVVEPDNSGNENYLRDMIQGTNSKIFKYNAYPETQLKSILAVNDDLNLFTSSWSRNYDFSTPAYVNYIFASYLAPGNSQAIVQFKWTQDRINFSNWINLTNNQRYFLKQKVTSIYYRIQMIESYDGVNRFLPSIVQLYHATIIPAQQTFVTYPYPVNGQIFENLAMASLGNVQGADIVAVVGRTQSSDTTYFEATQLNRNSVLPNRQTSFRIRPAFSLTGLTLYPYSKDSDGNYNYYGFYVIDQNQNIVTWDANTDKIILYTVNSKLPITPGSGTWQIQNSAAGQIKFTIPTDTIPLPTPPNYTFYFVDISYAELRNSIIGEPTSTYDFKTYYFLNGRIPTDAQVVVLINQIIFRGSYSVDYYDGAIIFDVARDSTDYVSVFVKFANYFRTGIQIATYDTSTTAFQSFNYTYTSLPDLPTYAESFQSDFPYVFGAPYFSPVKINLNDRIFLNYIYKDDLNIPESNSQIYWWRQRTGIEYAVYNSSVSLPITNGTYIGTTNIQINAASGATPFALMVSFNCAGTTANISSAYIVDRGLNYVGMSTYIQDTATISFSTTLITSFPIINNINSALYVVAQNPIYSSGYITQDGFVRINPLSKYGYSTNNSAYSSPPTLFNLPNYDSLTQEQSADIAARGLFDFRDNIYATITPYNGYAYGVTAKTSTVTVQNQYTPSASNLQIINAVISTSATYTGIITVYNISSSQNQTGIYSYFTNITGQSFTSRSTSASNAGNNYDLISWYKTNTTQIVPLLISTSGVLSYTLINVNDNIQFTVNPSVVYSDGSLGFGNTVYSELYRVV